VFIFSSAIYYETIPTLKVRLFKHVRLTSFNEFVTQFTHLKNEETIYSYPLLIIVEIILKRPFGLM